MLPAEMCEAKPMLIAHPGVSESEMASSRLRQIYLNRSKKWTSGQRIRLTILSNALCTTTFMEEYLGKSSAQFNRYWKRQLFSGKGIPPEDFHSLEDLVHYIQTTEGALGFIDCETPPEGVIVITLVD